MISLEKLQKRGQTGLAHNLGKARFVEYDWTEYVYGITK